MGKRKKLSKRMARKFHRELWDWLYHNPSRNKSNWPGWEINGGPHEDKSSFNECFACDWVEENDGVCGEGEGCLFSWVVSESCIDYGSYFRMWEEAKTFYRRKKYAKLIRDLPLRK